jgi:hypothetical protein
MGKAIDKLRNFSESGKVQNILKKAILEISDRLDALEVDEVVKGTTQEHDAQEEDRIAAAKIEEDQKSVLTEQIASGKYRSDAQKRALILETSEDREPQREEDVEEPDSNKELDWPTT